jgi:OmcA/MtrC family decaheme c-type cytochrome
MKSLARLLILAIVVATLGLFGCSGDDGDDGNDGAPGKSAYEIAVDNGYTGTEQEWLASVTPQVDPESCAVCHNSIEETHAVTYQVEPNEAVTAKVTSATYTAGVDVKININVQVDGVNDNGFTSISGAYRHYNNGTDFIRASISSGDRAVVSNGGGNYTVTITGTNVAASSSYLITLRNTDGAYATVVAQDPSNGGTPIRDIASNDGCVSCHGTYVFDGGHHGANPPLEACVVCHVRDNTANFNSENPDGTYTAVASEKGMRLTLYVHGVHNSHNMPGGMYVRSISSTTGLPSSTFSVGYPSDMGNCSVCHTGDRLETVVSYPVSYSLCMSCHVNWDGFVDHDGNAIFAADNFHRGAAVDTDCMACHGVISTLDEVADFHNSFEGTDAHYDSFYRGEDISFANSNEVGFAITGVTSDGSNVSFTWTASKLGAPVDPCNTNVATGPTFQALGAYLAYAKGDDWVNEGVSTTPGQPAGSKNLFTSLATTCAANVATTTGLVLDPDTTYAQKVLLAIGGKPLDQDNFVIGSAATAKSYFVRVPSPTYAFSPTDGSAVAARRDAVDTEKCTSCHRGTLYQHGGDRVDNEQLCVICHNPSSGEKNNRLDRYQIVNEDGTVNTDATYDGKNDETYDMRVLLHAIHGVEKRDKPIVIYRSRGVYAFATADAEQPTGWPADGMTIYGSTNDSKIAHNWTVVHYPRSPRECAACHNDEAYEVPDQSKAVALTVDPGADYSDQSDDIVIGPTAAACTACHATVPVMVHATSSFGYKANVTKDVMLEKASN